MGATFLYFLLLGLCLVGLSESSTNVCASKQRILLHQKNHIEYLAQKYRTQAAFLREKCAITLPDISISPGDQLTSPPSFSETPNGFSTQFTPFPSGQPSGSIGGQPNPSGQPSAPIGGQPNPSGQPSGSIGGQPNPSGQPSGSIGGQPNPSGQPSGSIGGQPNPSGQPSAPIGGLPNPSGQPSGSIGGQPNPSGQPSGSIGGLPNPSGQPSGSIGGQPNPSGQPSAPIGGLPNPSGQPSAPIGGLPNPSGQPSAPIGGLPNPSGQPPSTGAGPGDKPGQSESKIPNGNIETLSPSNPNGVLLPIQTNKPCCTPDQITEDTKLTTVELIKKYGYKAETYFIKTKDGYILCLHRIPNPGRQPILLVHGLMSSSATWVQMGPSHGLAYILFEQGYDIWLLNTRGNIYSKEHENAAMDPKDYWNFSFHEIGIYDLPPTIDMIIEVTRFPWIQYIGHGQGSTAFFVMCSEIPNYARKVTLMQALSPSVYMENAYSPVLKFLSLFKGKFTVLLSLLGGYEISRENNLIAQFKNYICKGEITSKLCAVFEFVTCGFGWNHFNTSFTPVVLSHSSQGASSIQVYHYAQMLSSVRFQRFDKGALLNYATYRSTQPPAYNLTHVSCNVALHHGIDDWLSAPKDVSKLQYQLPHVLDVAPIENTGFSHYDYILSKDVGGQVYARLVRNCHKLSFSTRPHRK